MVQIILSGVVFVACTVIMVTIGVLQLKSEKPVSFYTGETPPKESEISDLKAWNTKHGTMWIVYGGVIAVSWIIMLFLRDSKLAMIPCLAGLLVPVPFMIMYHNKLKAKYYKKENSKTAKMKRLGKK